ncbi:OmpA family protein [Prosthecobacter sp.]|uniref:OmpA family protein n=1 Tax=Prosthecobacter sp. TaxID=1965333 RepID=UPI0024877302|nr:OmpA family protein [Prosthecobacter sp.]MDI1310932.1 OmpA family protein [Prosthecobacter sp.]
MKLLSILPIVLALASSSLLRAQDIPDSKDPLGLKRYEGTRITFFEEKTFDSYNLPLGKFSARNIPTAKGTFTKSEKLEGKVTRVTYAGSDGKRTSLEVFRNYQSTLAEQGWEVLWTGSDAEMGDMRRLFADRPGQTFSLGSGGHFMAAKKGSNHLALFIANFKNGVVVPISSKPTAGAPVIALDVIESAAMDEKMVVIKADAMASALLDQGGVNLYGFYFDTGSAKLKSESSPTLDEVEKLLKADGSLRLLVVGHTDGVGGFEDNMDLSKRRASAVTAALSERVPNAASRLTPCGVGLQCPIATNSNEEGRAKNRRVALVKVEK